MDGTREMSLDEGEPAADVVAMRPFVPAKGFGASLRFYADLGFTAFRLGDGLASMHLSPFAFLLRSYDREGFAENLMMYLLVRDVAGWWACIAAPDFASRYGVRPAGAAAMGPGRRLCRGPDRSAVAHRRGA